MLMATFEKLGSSSVGLFALRRANMRSLFAFVKRVNTTYCAFLLGQSQDVDFCARLCKFVKRQAGGRLSAASPGAQAGCVEVVLSRRRMRRERGCPRKSKWGATSCAFKNASKTQPRACG